MNGFDYMDGRPAVNDEHLGRHPPNWILVRRWALRHNASAPSPLWGAILVRLGGGR